MRLSYISQLFSLLYDIWYSGLNMFSSFLGYGLKTCSLNSYANGRTFGRYLGLEDTRKLGPHNGISGFVETRACTSSCALHELVCPPTSWCSTKALTRCCCHALGHPIFQSLEGNAISVIHNLPKPWSSVRATDSKQPKAPFLWVGLFLVLHDKGNWHLGSKNSSHT